MLRPLAPVPLLVTITAAAALVGGCVQRTIHITSSPSGARVHLNDQQVGRTPLSVPFKFYGKYDVRLEKDGYQPKWTTADAVAPWWEYPGPDLIAEAIPGARSEVDWHFQLAPATAAQQQDPDKLLDRARQMRAMAQHAGQSSK